jgi:hypothetical protein
MTAAATTKWRPFTDDPLLTAGVLSGWSTMGSSERDRLTTYLSALTEKRGIVHVNVACNAICFGYDLTEGGYVGGPIDPDRFPRPVLGARADALPVGAMVCIETGSDPLYAEIVYKEGAHPNVSPDGYVPAWLSGAPAGAHKHATTENDSTEFATVLTERLVLDYAAFGSGLAVSKTQLDRLRRRAHWIDSDGHLMLEACYRTAEKAEADDVGYYVSYLLGPGREQLIESPLPFLLHAVDDATLTTAIKATIATITDAFAAMNDVRQWRGYALSVAHLTRRLKSNGPVGGPDLSSIANALCRPGSRHSGAATYTAIGPLLRGIRGAEDQLTGVAYAEAICHANHVIATSLERPHSTALGMLRLDDGWQGGGVWRTGTDDTGISPLVPLGLGWISELPPADISERGDDDSRPQVTSVTDSQVSWRATLRLKNSIAGQMALPERFTEALETHGMAAATLRVALTHEGYDLDPDEASQTATITTQNGRQLLTGLSWPIDYFPGVVLTFTWQLGALWLRIASTRLGAAVVIDGIEYEHRYDLSALTRDSAPGQGRGARGGRNGTDSLSLDERILAAVRRVGLLEPDGSATLPADQLAALVYGPGSPAAAAVALEPAITALVARGTLSDTIARLGGTGFSYDRATAPGECIRVLRWTPVITAPQRDEPSPVRAREPSQEPEYEITPDGTRIDYWVNPFLRRLAPGWKARDEARAQYAYQRERLGLPPKPLADGFTLVNGHTRSRSGV